MSKTPRLSRKQAIILNLLTGAKELYGLELVRDSDGALKRGTIYVTLSRMQDAGLIESRLEDPPAGHRGPPRRKYKPTGLGETALASWLDGMAGTFGGLRLAWLLVATPSFPLSELLLLVGVVSTILLFFGIWIASVRREERYTFDFDDVFEVFEDGIRVRSRWTTVRKVLSGPEIRWIDESHVKPSKEAIAWEKSLRPSLKQVVSAKGMSMLHTATSLLARRLVRRPKRRIQLAPGSRSMKAIRMVCSSKCVKEIVDTTYADFCVDYHEAEDAGETGRMRALQLRLYWDLFRAVGLFSVVRAGGHLFKEIIGVFGTS